MQHNDLLGILVAAFPNRACADEAIRDLHHAGVRHTWLGITKRVPSSGEHERVEDLGLTHVVARWLHRDQDVTLYDALREHGVADAKAQLIDGAVPDGDCILVAEDVVQPAEAASIAVRHGAAILSVPEEIDVSVVDAAPDPIGDTRIEAARRHPARQAAQ